MGRTSSTAGSRTRSCSKCSPAPAWAPSSAALPPTAPTTADLATLARVAPADGARRHRVGLRVPGRLGGRGGLQGPDVMEDGARFLPPRRDHGVGAPLRPPPAPLPTLGGSLSPQPSPAPFRA